MKRRLARELHVPAVALELENDGGLELPAASLLRYLVG